MRTSRVTDHGHMRRFWSTADIPIPQMSYKPAEGTPINGASISSGLVLAYPMPEGTGATINDYTTSPINGTLTGTRTWVDDETYTRVLEFNGGISTTAHDSKVNLETYTLAYAFNTTSSSGYGYTVSKFGSSGPYPFLSYIGPGGSVGAGIYDGGSQIHVVSAATGYSDGEWHRVVITRVKSGNFRLYVDGVLQDSDTDSVGSTTNTSGVFIGADAASTGAFVGKIAHVHLWNRELTGAPGSIGDPATGEIAAITEDEFLMYR